MNTQPNKTVPNKLQLEKTLLVVWRGVGQRALCARVCDAYARLFLHLHHTAVVDSTVCPYVQPQPPSSPCRPGMSRGLSEASPAAVVMDATSLPKKESCELIFVCVWKERRSSGCVPQRTAQHAHAETPFRPFDACHSVWCVCACEVGAVLQLSDRACCIIVTVKRGRCAGCVQRRTRGCDCV